jgi:Mg2+-importing ATPase
MGAALIGILLPLSPLGPVFGFVAPLPAFYLFLATAVLVYLAMVELVKRLSYCFMMPRAG